MAKIGKYIFLAQNFKKLSLLDSWGKNVNFKPIPAFFWLFLASFLDKKWPIKKIKKIHLTKSKSIFTNFLYEEILFFGYDYKMSQKKAKKRP